jgi:hypothetical protein
VFVWFLTIFCAIVLKFLFVVSWNNPNVSKWSYTKLLEITHTFFGYNSKVSDRLSTQIFVKITEKYLECTIKFHANPLLVNAHFFNIDKNRFNNFLLKKLDNYNNMKKAYTFLGQNASFKGSWAQFQKKYSENMWKIHFYISHKWPIF